MRTAGKVGAVLILSLLLSSVALAWPYQCTSAIAANFNATAIPAGDFVWFNSSMAFQGLSSSPVQVYVKHASVTFTSNGKTYTLEVPPSLITFSSTVDLATTSYITTKPAGWETDLQFSGLTGNDFLSGVTLAVPAEGIPGGIQDVTWQATFSSNTPNLTVSWQWAAAAYTSFDSEYDGLGVKPIDDDSGSQYQNSDYAGTPENFKGYVTAGGTGDGGSNYTGSYSGTASCTLKRQSTTSLTVSR
jgi:hypothetical protein